MKLLKVANMALDEALFWEDEAKDNENEATITEAINGAQIVFAKKRRAQALNFNAKESAWNSKKTLEALIKLADESLKKEVILTTTRGEIKARFDYALGAVSGEALFVGCDIYFLSLKFQRV